MIIIECIIFCLLFTFMVYIMSRDPLKMLFDYPPLIQERVKSLDEYKDKIPDNKYFVKVIFSILLIIIFSLILRFINGYESFIDGFRYGFLIWSIVNLYDFIILDVIWFCHDPHFVIKGTCDMVDEYHNYLFHFKGFLVGEILGVIVCALAGLIIGFIL